MPSEKYMQPQNHQFINSIGVFAKVQLFIMYPSSALLSVNINFGLDYTF